MTEARREPWCWVTWLTGLLSGDKVCRYAPWFKAHFTKYEKVPSDFNLIKWKADHADVVQAVVRHLVSEGWVVSVEGQNKFRVRGENGVLSGQPDIIAVKPDVARVIDVKTGTPHDSDQWQAVTYLAALLHQRPELRAVDDLKGVVYYLAPDDAGKIDIERRTIAEVPFEQPLVDRVWREARAATDDIQPEATPSEDECGFCDILECPDRMGAVLEPEVEAAF